MAAASDPLLPLGKKHTELWLECFTTPLRNSESHQQSLLHPITRIGGLAHIAPVPPTSLTTAPKTPFGPIALWFHTADPAPNLISQDPSLQSLLGPDPFVMTTMGLDVRERSPPLDTSAVPVRATTQSEIAPGLLASDLVCTPLRPLQFERELASHRDNDFVCQLVRGISQGFRIEYKGPHFNFTCANLPSASLNPIVINGTLQRECEADRLAGPFPSPPLHYFRSSGIGLIPKKDGKCG